MASDSINDTSANVFLKYPELPRQGFVKFVGNQDEVSYTPDSVKLQNTVLQKKVVSPEKYTKSFVNVYSAKAKDLSVNPYNFYNTSWILWILLFCFVVYAYLQRHFSKKQSIIFKSFFNLRYTNQLIREGNIYNESGFYFLLFLSLITCGLYILGTGSYFMFGNLLFFNSFMVFIRILLFFTAAYFGKFLLLRILATVFKLEKLYSEFVLTQHIFIITSGVLALFISTFIFFTPYRFVVLFSVLAFLSLFSNYLFRLYMLTSGTGIFSLYYFILYICTVEILPLLFVYKLTHK